MEIINFYDGFNEKYNEKLSKKELVEAWYQFMDEHKLVRDMCINDYENENLDWQHVAYDKVFFYDADYVQKMNETVKLLEMIILTMKDRLHIFYGTDSIDAVVFNLLQIGELAKSKLSYTFKKTHSDIPWNDIYGFKNRIVHT